MRLWIWFLSLLGLVLWGACGGDGDGSADASPLDASSPDALVSSPGAIEASWTLEAACPETANQITMRVHENSEEVAAPGGPCSPAGSLQSATLSAGNYDVWLEVGNSEGDTLFGRSETQMVIVDEPLETLSFSFDPSNQTP